MCVLGLEVCRSVLLVVGNCVIVIIVWHHKTKVLAQRELERCPN